MNKLLLSAALLLAIQSNGCEDAPPTTLAASPSATPIPRIKCDPIESNGMVLGWHCVDMPPECVAPKLPRRPGQAPGVAGR